MTTPDAPSNTETADPKQLDHQALVDFTRRWFTLWTEADPQARSRRGHDEIDRRVTQAYAMFVEPDVYTFKAAGDAVLLAPALVGSGWEMVTVTDGTVAGSGYDVIALDDNGRILLDHQHIAPS